MFRGIFATVLFCFVLIDGKQFRFDYDFYPEADGWLKMHLLPAEWVDARLTCFREGGVLASPENENLLAAMKRLVKSLHMQNSRGIFTGTHATYSKGYYYSIEGVPLSRMPVIWAPGEPDNVDGAEACLLMLLNGTFADENCSKVHPYVCFKKRTADLAITSCGTVDKSYVLDHRTGSCYKFHSDPQSWSRAFAACSSEGGHLAIINSVTEAEVLKELYALHPVDSMSGRFTKHVAHIGHSEWGARGLWMTVHGQTLKEAGYSAWAAGQPDNVSSQFCGAMFGDAKLDDIWCDSPCPFICEKNPDSLLIDEDF